MQHWWSGGTFPGYAKTRVKYYVDGERVNPLNLPLGLAHGQDDVTEDNGPWSAGSLFGKSGAYVNVRCRGPTLYRWRWAFLVGFPRVEVYADCTLTHTLPG